MATLKDIKKGAKQNKPDGIQLTATEVKMIKDLNESKQFVVNEFASIGQLEATTQLRKEENINRFKQNSEVEIQLSNTLMVKYGDGRIDIDNELFIPLNG
jgi:hypothetical protein